MRLTWKVKFYLGLFQVYWWGKSEEPGLQSFSSSSKSPSSQMTSISLSCSFLGPGFSSSTLLLSTLSSSSSISCFLLNDSNHLCHLASSSSVSRHAAGGTSSISSFSLWGEEKLCHHICLQPFGCGLPVHSRVGPKITSNLSFFCDF